MVGKKKRGLFRINEKALKKSNHEIHEPHERVKIKEGTDMAFAHTLAPRPYYYFVLLCLSAYLPQCLSAFFNLNRFFYYNFPDLGPADLADNESQFVKNQFVFGLGLLVELR
jgi:hypothetical protein